MDAEGLPHEGTEIEQLEADLEAAQQKLIAACEVDFKANPSAANRRQWRQARGVVGALDVLKAPLPTLQYEADDFSISRSPSSQRPAEVRLWEGIPRRMAGALRCLRDVELETDEIPMLSGLDLEEHQNVAFISNMNFQCWAGQVVGSVLAAAGRPERIKRFAKPTNHNGKPDWEVHLKGPALNNNDSHCAIMFGVGQSPASMQDVPDDLVGHYNTDHQGKVFSCILPQLYGYLLSNELRYGWLTTYERTWFVKVVGDILYVSPVVHSTDVSPSVRQMLCWLALRRDRRNPRSSGAVDALCSPGGTSAPPKVDCGAPACSTLLGFKLLPDDAVVVNRRLGSGAIGVVRAGSVYGREAALKMADAHNAYDDVELLKHEAAIYGEMLHLQGDVIPKLVECAYINGGNGFLLATDLVHGEHPSTVCVPSAKQRASAVKGLKAIHAAGFLHGDVRCENLVMERGSSKVIFLDLAFSQRGPTLVERSDEMRELRLTTRCVIASAAPSSRRQFHLAAGAGRRMGWKVPAHK